MFAKKDYRDALVEFFNSPDSFADESQADSAGTRANFTYPIKLKINNPYSIPNGSYSVQASFLDEAGNPVGEKTTGAITVTGAQGGEEFHLFVPAQAAKVTLKSEHFHLREVAIDSTIDEAALFETIVPYRWRNIQVRHTNEWTPDGVRALLAKLRQYGKLTQLFDVRTDKAYNALVKNLLPLTWWNRPKTADDPYGENPILGAEGSEQSLFGAGPNQLPATGQIDNLHPVTCLWLIKILESKKRLRIVDKYEPAAPAVINAPPLYSGWITFGATPRVGDALHCAAVFNGSISRNEGTFKARLGTQLLTLEPIESRAGAAVATINPCLWGEWELIIAAASGLPVVPREAGSRLSFAKPQIAPVLTATKTKKQVEVVVSFEENMPVSLMGLIYFRYWVTDKNKEPAVDDEGTLLDMAYPVTSKTESNTKDVSKKLTPDQTGNYFVGEKTYNAIKSTFGLENYKGSAQSFKIAMALLEKIQAIKTGFGNIHILTVAGDGCSADIREYLFNKAYADFQTSVAQRFPGDPRIVFNDTKSTITVTAQPSASKRGSLFFTCTLGTALDSMLGLAGLTPNKAIHLKAGFFCPNGFLYQQNPLGQRWVGNDSGEPGANVQPIAFPIEHYKQTMNDPTQYLQAEDSKITFTQPVPKIVQKAADTVKKGEAAAKQGSELLGKGKDAAAGLKGLNP
jgi:hypothetical protein